MSPSTDPIKHVVLLLLENHSFDEMLGCFRERYPDLEGIDPANPGSNTDDSGNVFKQEETRQVQMDLDPGHKFKDVKVQLANNNGGFIKSFIENHQTSSTEQRQQIMSFYPLMFLDALHRMARDFTICDHWFCSVPGPTWPNRFFAYSGTSSGTVRMPEGINDPDLKGFFAQNQTTLFDRLNEAKRSWKVYFYDFPSSLILNHQRRAENLARYFGIDQFFKEVANEAEFPEFCLIEPKFAGRDQNDDHPPHNVMKGEKLIADVYNALRSRTELWNSSLLVILFDEHGGFYDHVPPPAAVNPDDKRDETVGFGFDRLGVRVPAVLVSPWVDKRVENTVFDHTSLLKYLIEKWNLGPLGKRTAAANSIGVAIQRDTPRADTLPFIRVSQTHLTSPRPELEFEDSSEHHAALDAFGEHLLSELDAVGAAEIKRVAEAARVTARVKNSVGKKLIALGSRMTSEFQTHNRSRAAMITDVVLARLGKRLTPVAKP
jgi:phospholipase C